MTPVYVVISAKRSATVTSQSNPAWLERQLSQVWGQPVKLLRMDLDTVQCRHGMN